ncbi:hypothetical protein ARMGADRAFT_1029961 [Armillaria gallica]|uniref:Uncharacterized protein n=1 Tax=Armillaria gallica TaxID=47427 RepID=A0A2H3E0S1_ARMGA|nr:hypothetical protein ARMGADRAFT_1029961 [Armillaria gallica]
MPGLSNADIAEMLSNLGSEMDRVILASLLQGTSGHAGWSGDDAGKFKSFSLPSVSLLLQCYFKYLVLYAGLILASTLEPQHKARGVLAFPWNLRGVFGFGIAPTLLVGHIAVGHARPDDSWKGSVMTSPLCFGMTRLRRALWDILWRLMRTSKLSPGGEVAISMYMNVDRLALIKEDTAGEGLDSRSAHYTARFVATERHVWYNDGITLGWRAQLEGYMDEVDMIKNRTGKDRDIFIYKLT